MILFRAFGCMVACWGLSAYPYTVLKEIFTTEVAFHSDVLNSVCFEEDCLSALCVIKEKWGIHNIIDAGCGEIKYIGSLTKLFDYTGIDVVDLITDKNRKCNANEKATFLSLDIIDEKIPGDDLILCRDCLEYFSYSDIASALERFKESKNHYIFLSHCSGLQENTETHSGIRRGINFQIAPFYFPEPLYVSKEFPDETALALWKLEDLDFSRLLDFIFPPLTILSKPVGIPLRWEHAGVANSLRRGLSLVHRNFNINPDDVSEIKENVVVIADIEAGLQAYQWKEEGLIKTLMVGPNIVGTPEEKNYFVYWPLIDSFLSPSSWPIEAFERHLPALNGRFAVWFAGVDENYWKPSSSFQEKDSDFVLLYRKTDFDLCDQVKECLEARGFRVLSLTYGGYQQEEFKSCLEQSKFAVFVSRSESQGIALAESWSMDVPTLVWNPKEPVVYNGVTYENTSSAPYLNSMVGKDWKTMEDLETLLNSFDQYVEDFHPRRWALFHMIDKVSVEELLVQIRKCIDENSRLSYLERALQYRGMKCF